MLQALNLMQQSDDASLWHCYEMISSVITVNSNKVSVLVK